MPRYRHPRAGDGPGVPPAAVHISRAENAAVDDDGVFEAPGGVGRAVARQHGVSVAEIRVDDGGGGGVTDAAAAIDDGVCPWCDDYEGDAVGQHASSAHPDAWQAYKEGDG